MPLLQYYCENCKKRFDELVKSHLDVVYCPICKKQAKRCWDGVSYSNLGIKKENCNHHCEGCDGCK